MVVSLGSGEGGIRTHAPSRTNGFQDRLVMTTSIPLRIFWAYSVIISAKSQLVNTFLKKVYGQIEKINHKCTKYK